jgi:hypothetical protein
MLLFTDRSDDLGELCLDVRVVGAGFPDPREVVERRVLAVLGRQPSGGFLEEGQEAEHDAHRHELEADWDTPLHGAARRVDESNAVVDLQNVSWGMKYHGKTDIPNKRKQLQWPQSLGTGYNEVNTALSLS